ncbi:Rnf-Nqr domain containing protein [Pseudomonas sp. CCI3.2]|uniref:electron transport complex protein RnfA n=1 Tax=unclassified Pseudomonas TaxID=196821 RepID=UPI002AC94D41|nr:MULTISPECIES: Rnf-Nqr domain containing protein [unclassified Pseudomonas]MEB0075710.1 Rnf-Nqr domain containing protein [Pseudomonas sp. MH10out]MEB0092995.1 Rnf-Nqr domain containing protein [Pseudomonas sp. CCI4.2]MEB0099813.1 Rnf-Nqr domain containing protein [Pseudomonas sp. CCI3.2]MEB0131015.1 Rnf-Nqr domain containing protein [Pseudomonas sp. CCI2.4]MEB0158227.1 Rnf-Nqr domain containing protein [Pseudomonas sp. AH2 (2023)]
MTDFILTLISAALINNVVLQWPLGVDPVINTSREPCITRVQLHALGMATVWVMFCSTLLNYLLYHSVLVPLELGYLRLFVFLPVSVMAIKPCVSALSRLFPRLSFDGFQLLLVSNAGILGLALLSTQPDKGMLYALALSIGSGLGFWLVLSLFHDLQQRIQTQDVPLPFRALPIQLISAGLMGLAFLGFSGLIKP